MIERIARIVPAAAAAAALALVPAHPAHAACPDPATPGLYRGFTAASCAGSVVKVESQVELDAYLVDFGAGTTGKPRHLNVLFNPTGNVRIVTPCRIKLLGVSNLIDVNAGEVCLYGRAQVTVGAGSPAADSAIDAGAGDIALVSEEGRVRTKTGIRFAGGRMTVRAAGDATLGSKSTVTLDGPLAMTSTANRAMVLQRTEVTAGGLTLTAAKKARLSDDVTAIVDGDVTLISTGTDPKNSFAEVLRRASIAAGGTLAMSGVQVSVGSGAGLAIDGPALFTAARDAEIQSNAVIQAASLTMTAAGSATISRDVRITADPITVDAAECDIRTAAANLVGTVAGSCFELPVCAPSAAALCLNQGRFRVEVEWKDFAGVRGSGRAVPLTADTGSFWFFVASNLELMVKILDGRTINGHFWVFYASLSNVEFKITVTDLHTGTVRRYRNRSRQFASVGDTAAIPAPPDPGALAPPGAALALEHLAAFGPKGESPTFGVGAKTCAPTAGALCLNGGRFRAEITWRDFHGNTGSGVAVPLTGDTGAFWFFDAANLEILVKVLDGRTINGRFWVFYGALSDVEYTLTVTDTVTGLRRTYRNPAGRFASVGDTRAF